ncbi:MAG: hypothetical protein F6J95_030325 [Leptolyngbya sp. SIO1E4]|nr:hypothetical protein [Leptolyngbya sp. SIO1E4]
MRWKPLKWWLIGLLALFWALWASSGYVSVQANPLYQDTFEASGDLIAAKAYGVGNAFLVAENAQEKNAQVEQDALLLNLPILFPVTTPLLEFRIG